jgi:hypothetical protein
MLVNVLLNKGCRMNNQIESLDELRDRFAAAALTGLLANRSVAPQDTTLITRLAWEIAEEMLSVRQNKYEKPSNRPEVA